MPKYGYRTFVFILYVAITCFLIGSAYHYWILQSKSKVIEPHKNKKKSSIGKDISKMFEESSSHHSSYSSSSSSSLSSLSSSSYTSQLQPERSGQVPPSTVTTTIATASSMLPESKTSLSTEDNKTINFELNVNIHGKIPQTDGYDYSYIGCYNDSGTRVLPTQVTIGQLTPYQCAKECGSRNYGYFGVQDGFACFCGSSDYAKLGSTTGCDIACTGDSQYECGGVWKNSVYSISPFAGSNTNAGTTALKTIYLYDKEGNTIITKTFSDPNVGPSNNYINDETFIITSNDIGSHEIYGAGISVGNDDLTIDSAIITCYPLDLDLSNKTSYCYPNAAYSEIKINDKTIDANSTLGDLTFSKPISLNPACLSDAAGSTVADS